MTDGGLDRELHDYGARWRDSQPPAPSPVLPSRRAPGWIAPVATAAAAALVVGGTSLAVTSSRHHRTAPASPVRQIDLTGTVPWVNRPAPPPMSDPAPSPIALPPANARPCTATDVRVHFLRQEGGGGTAAHIFTFRNVGKSTCLLQGYPSLIATGAGQPDLSAEHDAHPLLSVNERAANIAPGQVASVNLETNNGCWPQARDTFYDRVVFSLPGGSMSVRLSKDDRLYAACGLGAGKFYVKQQYTSPQPNPLTGLQASLELPSEALAGSTLVYVVDLHNPTPRTVPLSPCPGYGESAAFPARADESYALNCDSVQRIGPHSSIRYEMRLKVPSDVPTGSYQLDWTISASPPPLMDYPAADGTLVVRGSDNPCRADQVTLSIPDAATTITHGAPVKGPQDHGTGVILVVTNTSDRACSLRDAPTFVLVANDEVLASLAEPAPPPTSTVVLAAHGGRATTRLTWDVSWCGPRALVVTVRVTLPLADRTVDVVPAHGWPPPQCRNAVSILVAEPLQPGS
jgi:hypothetical protein